MLLYYAITALHVLVCVILVLVVLLQSGKGADLAGAFGGGATQTAFGSRGPASLLSKVTTGAAILFMVTSISLSMISAPVTSTGGPSVLDDAKGVGTQTEKDSPDKKSNFSGPTDKDDIRKEVDRITKEKQAAPAVTPDASKPPAEK